MTTNEMIEKLRYKANNIKAHIEPEFFNDVADVLEKYQWIDVFDRLPEDDKGVLICSRWGIMDIGYYYNGGWTSEYITYDDGDVIAWMPLPEPYKKEVE